MTPLQIACAYATVANKGILMKPFIVKRIVDGNNETIEEHGQQVVRRVIAPATAQLLTSIFEGVVNRGTGSIAKVDGIRIAGKTGTSRKFANGRYVPGDYTASFVGYFPGRRSESCVPCDARQSAGRWIHRRARQCADLPRHSTEDLHALRPVRQEAGNRPCRPPGHSPCRMSRKWRPKRQNPSSRTAGSKSMCAEEARSSSDRPPPPVRGSRAGGNILLQTNEEDAGLPHGYVLVPDVVHLPMRKAVTRLSLQQLDASIRGSGLVVAQSPAPGRAGQSRFRASFSGANPDTCRRPRNGSRRIAGRCRSHEAVLRYVRENGVDAGCVHQQHSVRLAAGGTGRPLCRHPGKQHRMATRSSTTPSTAGRESLLSRMMRCGRMPTSCMQE